MTASYSFVALPLDPAAAAASPTRFDLNLIATIAFSSGMIDNSDTAAAVAAHPLLGLAAGAPVRALALPFPLWLSAGKQIVAGAAGVKTLALTYRGKRGFPGLRATLSDYLARPAPVTVTSLAHDAAADMRKAADFFDPAGMHDRVQAVRGLLEQRFLSSFGLTAARQVDDLSDRTVGYARQRWLGGGVQAGLIELIFGSTKAQDVGLGADGARLLAALKRDVAQLERRMDRSDQGAASVQALHGSGQAADPVVDPRDPNVAIHAALTNSLIAERCGIVTSWTASGDVPAGDYVIMLDPACLAGGAAGACRMTAFRRGEATHPLSVLDVGKPTTQGGLAMLNDAKGRPRYSCTGINAEVAVIQATLLQANNSLSGGAAGAMLAADIDAPQRDDRPPVELAAQQFGYNELEASGLTISAPAEDLVLPAALASPTRETDLPCLFHEDLWIGYRLDLAPAQGAPLRSIHWHSERISFAGSGASLTGDCEDYWPRDPNNRDAASISTEIMRYNGLSSSQSIDYARFLGTYKPAPLPPGAPFKADIAGSAGVTPLRFGRRYDYRLRSVFQGAVSYRDDDARLAAAGPAYAQTLSYGRARSFRAGEVVMPLAGRREDDQGPLSVLLTDEAPRRTLLIAPSPIDSDIARYNGQFLSNGDEPGDDVDRAFVKDLAGYFAGFGTNAPYYCDPDVDAIQIELWMRNGDPAAADRDVHYMDGSYCEVVEPLHLGPVTARFGPKGQWRDFRPIELRIATGSDVRPQLKVDAGGRRVRITLPPSADVEIVLTPIVPRASLEASAAFQPSSSLAALFDTLGGAAATVLPVVEHRIRAIHCVRRPAMAPVIVSAAQTPSRLALLKRQPFSPNVELTGYIEADAASTGDVQISGSWPQIDDNPMHERFVVKAGQSMSRPRSLVFSDYPLPSSMAMIQGLANKSLAGFAAIEQAIGQQCAENKLFLGTRPVAAGPAPGGEAPSCSIPLGDGRRARLTLVATAKSRYFGEFGPAAAGAFERTSAPLLADVPASMLLPPPVISHVMPLVRQVDGQDKLRRTRQRLYGFRIYARRPYFLSGLGERLAIGCRAGPRPRGTRQTIDKAFTQWGEDPIARTRSQASRRLPRATDFRVTEEIELEAALYPPDSPEGSGSVLYFDDVVREPGRDDADNARLSLASFALQWDDIQKLWFCDIELANDFSGWLGLALYRHQPLAEEGLQLSRTAAWVYSMVLHGERVSWVTQSGLMHVTIGPVFDRTISFEAEERRYRDGVSAAPVGVPVERLAFKSYEVDSGRYFEGVFRAGPDGLEIVRRRFDHDIASFRLEGK